MSEDKVTKNSLVNIEVPKCLDTTVKNLTNKPSETIGATLSDCLFLVFGGINQKAALKRVKYEHELKCFAKELEEKVDEIPDEKRLEPNIHVVCTALESMRFCVEEPELRHLFASLIANSINDEKSQVVHPSYGEIIKQLTSFDAQVFVWLNRQEAIPTMRLQIDVKEKNEFKMLPNIYLESAFGNHEKLQIALDNLSRLKLIDIKLQQQYANKGIYDCIIKSEEFSNDEKKIKNQINENEKVSYSYGLIDITKFGRLFYNACS